MILNHLFLKHKNVNQNINKLQMIFKINIQNHVLISYVKRSIRIIIFLLFFTPSSKAQINTTTAKTQNKFEQINALITKLNKKVWPQKWAELLPIKRFDLISDTTLAGKYHFLTSDDVEVDSIDLILKKLQLQTEIKLPYYYNRISIFHRPILFYFCRFAPNYSNTDSINVQVLQHSLFDSLAIFDNVKYYCGKLHFWDDIFSQTLYIHADNNILEKDTSREAPELWLNACRFKNGISFNNKYQPVNDGYPKDYMAFRKDVIFSESIIEGKLDLSGCTFKNNSTLRIICSLPDTLDLSFATLSSLIDLTSANRNVKNIPCEINLLKVDLDKIKLHYRNFHLYFPDSLLKNPKYKDWVISTYENLLANFKRNGIEESFKKLDIEYRLFKWQHSWASFLPCIPYYWNHFGYEKQFVFLWTVFFVLLFTIVKYFFLLDLSKTYKINKFNEDEIHSFKKARFTVKDSLKRMWYALVFSSTVFFSISLKVELIDFKKLWPTTLIIIMYVIGIVCLAYMGSFVLEK